MDAVLVVALVKIYYVLEFLWKFLIKGKTLFSVHFFPFLFCLASGECIESNSNWNYIISLW